MLNAQLAHIGELRVLDCVHVGPLEIGSKLLQKPHTMVDAVLLIGIESVSPNEELVGKLYPPTP